MMHLDIRSRTKNPTLYHDSGSATQVAGHIDNPEKNVIDELL